MDGLAKGQYLTLDASGLSVGLPAGLMGNSEVGHFTIGTGRVVYQVGLSFELCTLTSSDSSWKEHCQPHSCLHVTQTCTPMPLVSVLLQAALLALHWVY